MRNCSSSKVALFMTMQKFRLMLAVSLLTASEEVYILGIKVRYFFENCKNK